MLRNLPWSCLMDAVVSAVLLAAATLSGQTHEGTVMTASQEALMVETETAQVIFDVPSGAIVRLDGETVSLSALQPGFHVVVRATEREGRLVASEVSASSNPAASAHVR